MFSVQGIQFSIFTFERSGLCSLRERWHSHVMRSWNPSCSSASPQWGAEWWMGRHPLLQKNSCNSCFSLVWHQCLGLPKSNCCLLAQRVTEEENNLPERNSKDWKLAFLLHSSLLSRDEPSFSNHMRNVIRNACYKTPSSSSLWTSAHNWPEVQSTK